MQRGSNPFGDGRASRRIVLAVRRWLAGTLPLLAASEEFSSLVKAAPSHG